MRERKQQINKAHACTDNYGCVRCMWICSKSSLFIRMPIIQQTFLNPLRTNLVNVTLFYDAEQNLSFRLKFSRKASISIRCFNNSCAMLSRGRNNCFHHFSTVLVYQVTKYQPPCQCAFTELLSTVRQY